MQRCAQRRILCRLSLPRQAAMRSGRDGRRAMKNITTIDDKLPACKGSSSSGSGAALIFPRQRQGETISS